MAKDTQNRGSTPHNHERQSRRHSQQTNRASGSHQQMNRGPESGTSSNISGTQSSSQHSGTSIPGLLSDRVDIPGVISQRVDEILPNRPRDPGPASSQYSNAVSTGTGSGGFPVTIPPPDSHPVWEGVLDPAILEKLGSDRKT